jgi:gamma-glutamyltranspeptidase/glutathione hydrolase
MGASTPGVVAAGAQVTAEAGAQVLAAGGNAVDAVCAASFAAFVAEGLLCSPAGGGAALIADADHGARVLDFFASVPGLGLPAGAPHDFTNVDVDFGPTVQQFHVGRAAAAVPGALRGILQLHTRAGRLPLSELVTAAVAAGQHGFEVGGPMAYVTQILAPILDVTPEVQALFRPGASDPSPGQRLDNPALADFLEALARDPDDAVAQFESELLARFGPSRGGLVTRADLQAYAPTWRDAVQVPAGDATLFTNPPPSSGGTLIALGLHAVDAAALTADGFLGPAHVRETAALLGGLDRVRAAGYDVQVARPGAQARWLGDVGHATIAHAVAHARRDLGSTTHVSVLTEDGELASLTMSNGEGCGHAIGPLGIHLNNFLGEDDINPGGFHRVPAGTRMTTMMAPSAVIGPEGPRLVLGSGGSSRIRSAILQVLLAIVVHGRSLRDAVAAPRLHVEGGRLWWEAPDLPSDSARALLHAWPDATRFDARNLFFGGVHAVGRDADGRLHGMGDPRRGGTVATSSR